MRNFLDIGDISPADLRLILDQAHEMKAARAGKPKGAQDAQVPLKDHAVALIFEKPSTRTRVSFDIGVHQMGGHSLTLSSKDMMLGNGESIPDTARVMSRYVDLIMLRTFDENTLHTLSEAASIPLINGLTDQSHPCQVMADLMTYEEHRGPIAGKKVLWAGEGNNVCVSWLQAAAQFGCEFIFVGPPSLKPAQKHIDTAQAKGINIRFETDMLAAAQGVDLVLTDTWVSMHEKEKDMRAQIDLCLPYQVTAQVMAQAAQDALFMHCLPAYRGKEATDEVLDGPHSVIFDEAENRVHAQKAIMRWCLGV